MTAGPERRTRGYPRELIALAAVVCTNMIGFGVIIPMLPFFARSLSAPEWQITLMFAAFSLGQFLGEPFFGRLSDRIGRKPVLLITILANVAGYVALAFAPSIGVAILIRLATGFGAGNISTVQAFICDVTPPEERVGRMGLIGASFGLGFIVGPALGGFISNAVDGRMAFQAPLFVAAGLSALSVLGVLLIIKESRVHVPPNDPPWTALGEALRHPVLSRALLITLIYMAGLSAMEAVFALWAERRFGWGAGEVGVAFMTAGLVTATTQALITGRLARRFGEARVIVGGMMLFGVTMIVQTLNNWPVLTTGLMVFSALGISLVMPNISAMVSRASPVARQGSMLGLNMATGAFGRIVGPVAAGFAFSGLGHNWPFWIAAAVTIPAAFAALSAGRRLAAARAAAAAL